MKRRSWPDNPIALRCCPPMTEATEWGRYVVVDDSDALVTVQLWDDLTGFFGTPITYCPWCGMHVADAIADATAASSTAQEGA